MAQNEMKKVKISDLKINDKFINVIVENGTEKIEYGVSRERSPKLIAILEKAKAGDEVIGEYFFYNNKHYLSDPKDAGKARTSTPRDKSLDAGIAAWEGACQAYALDKEKSDEKILALAQKGYDFIIGKVTKATEDVKK